jgi:hypothetical protein
VGDFARLTVEWSEWVLEENAWRCRGAAEVAGNSSILFIDVVDRLGTKPSEPTITAWWQDGTEPRDEAVLRVARREGLSHAAARRKAEPIDP